MTTKRFLLRLPLDLFEEVEARAQKHLRSVNNEIITLLKLGMVNERDEAEALDATDRVIPKPAGEAKE